MPRVKVLAVGRCRYYGPRRSSPHGSIRISSQIPAEEQRGALAHELAHHVARCLGGPRGHGEFFFRCLVRVVGAMGLEYRWEKEYASIRGRARGEGLLP